MATLTSKQEKITICLELSEEEAAALLCVIGTVAGPQESPRQYTDNIYFRES